MSWGNNQEKEAGRLISADTAPHQNVFNYLQKIPLSVCGFVWTGQLSTGAAGREEGLSLRWTGGGRRVFKRNFSVLLSLLPFNLNSLQQEPRRGPLV